MVWGELIKAGVAIGASAIASDKLANAMTGAVEKSAEALTRAAKAANDGADTDQETEGSAKAFALPKRNVTAKCMGCHAPMAGTPGVRYRCPYCDTVQTLD